MESLNIEITESQYLIRLKRADFDLNNLYLLLKNLGAETPSSRNGNTSVNEQGMIKERTIDADIGERFDHLQDK
ncbi:hypothetical protein H8S90_11515 [Olivibacter sp. SDN3]|uniref:hypothetical protein n=1 Tax=Olivibacter sp. SDN3 TaxID=2764720 RepID=UPI00165157F0|nr:hypothetical protein [Olivibacter sp. SDN3]QNL52145.1 hypothetical protein H8S90_11515 [Olivibacter sp. SDN3]